MPYDPFDVEMVDGLKNVGSFDPASLEEDHRRVVDEGEIDWGQYRTHWPRFVRAAMLVTWRPGVDHTFSILFPVEIVLSKSQVGLALGSQELPSELTEQWDIKPIVDPNYPDHVVVGVKLTRKKS